ncbi:hypothetical protein [Lysinibacillus sp. G4S2]|uniref:RNA recognition motif domain-containing protein n=1 Tax=Lysinibacillus sp. G4S2 TaxID=3055859 RepID=UPI0025A08331|nr:hypothetical protein [Lysinibacillus sp. G4S2]MDM5246608.1 hypothetical protein [Lysinibacillus sp. G4S2]
MKKPIKKTWMIASVLTIGMAVLTPLQAGAASVETTNNSSITVQLEQKITGTIKNIYDDGMNLKGKDGKNYFISFHKFSDEQIEKMKLVEGQEISVEGNIAESFSDFFTFEVFKKDMPKEITKEDLTKLEKLFNEMKHVHKEFTKVEGLTDEEIEKKHEELKKIYEEIHKIIKPYTLANWQPQSFEEYMKEYGFNEKNIVIKENDNAQLKAIYEEWIKLEKSGDEEKANKKYEEFDKILEPYLDELNAPETFEEFMASCMKVTEILEIPAETLAKLKTLHRDLQKALKDENDELYDKLHEEFYGILNQFLKPQTFEEYMADFEFEVSEADSKQLKQLYEEILALDEKEEQEKIEEKWEAFYNILDPYFIANKEILISASKVTINGQDYLPQH